MTTRVLRIVLAALFVAAPLSADVSPPRHDPSCTLAGQSRFVGQCVECCMGDGCPHPEIRCPAEEGYLQRCIRFADPPYSAPTHAIWCNPNAKPKGVAALVALAEIPAFWIGLGLMGAVGAVIGVLLVRRKSSASLGRTRALERRKHEL